MKTRLNLLILAIALLAPSAFAQPTVFTYQGRLSQSGSPAQGQFDLQFTVRDNATNGNQIGPVLNIAPVTVADGQFQAALDFGPGVFTGPARWLEIGVRTNGSTDPYSILAPVQPLTSVPFAVHSLSASNLLGKVTDSQLSANIPRLNANQSFTGTASFNPTFGAPFTVNSSNKIAQLNADLLDNLDSTAFAPSNHSHSATNITAGTLADSRLSLNVPMLNKAQSFSGSNTFTGVLTATNSSNNLAGDGSRIANLSATNIVGVLPSASLPTSVARLNSNQTFTATTVFSPATGAPFAVTSTSIVANLNAERVGGLTAGAFWNTSGNSNTAGRFVGTLDSPTLELRASNSPVMRLTSTALGANITAGRANTVSGTYTHHSTVAGGTDNAVTASYGFIGAGFNNQASGYASIVGGGAYNNATNQYSSVPGGLENIAGGEYSFAAGRNARALHQGTFVWADSSGSTFTSTAANQFLIRASGGVGIGTATPSNALQIAGTVQADRLKLTTTPFAGALLTSDASGNASWQPAGVRSLTNGISPSSIGGHQSNVVEAGIYGATIAGGGSAVSSNYVNASYGTISGGMGNRVSGQMGVVAGGQSNIVNGGYAAVGGGVLNTALDYATVGGGSRNYAHYYATVAGGVTNNATASASTISGGETNTASGSRASIGGGSGNIGQGNWSVVSGGYINRANGGFSSIGGGYGNINNGYGSTIAGGYMNAVSNSYATIAGGYSNLASGSYSFAAGCGARAMHNGSFVWSDFSPGFFSSTAEDQFLVRASGGVGIGMAPTNAMLDVEGPVRINNYDLFLRGNADTNHGLGWYGNATRSFGGFQPDGPVLFGDAGGALGTRRDGPEVILSWNHNQQVGIGTAAPQETLSVAGGLNLDQGEANNGTLSPGLRFGSNGGEGIASKRTAGGNQDGLDFYTGSQIRMSLNSSGSLGIGTSTPGEKLELYGGDVTMNIHNSGDGPVGGFIQNTYHSLQLGLYNSGISDRADLPAGVKRRFFGMDENGQVGSMTSTTSSPSFRNLLDDGDGNVWAQGNIACGGDMRITDQDLFFRGDTNHGVGWYGSSKQFAMNSVDGPVLYGWNGGALGTTVPQAISLIWDRNKRVGIGGRTPVSNKLEVEGDASKTTAGSWLANSDRRIKTDISSISNALDALAQIQLVSFRYTDEYRAAHPDIQDRAYVNVIAQDFQKVFPEYVKGSGEKLASGEEILQVDTYPLTIYSAAAIQELHQIIQAKDERIETLEAKAAKVDQLEKDVAELKALVGTLLNK